MQIKTILNHVQKFKSFVNGEARLLSNTDQPMLEVDVHERRNSWAICSVCEQPASLYFFRWLGKERSAALQNVCSDMPARPGGSRT